MALSAQQKLAENIDESIKPMKKPLHVVQRRAVTWRFFGRNLANDRAGTWGCLRKDRAVFEARVHFDKADRFIRNLESSSKLIIADVFPEPHRSLFNEGYGVVDLVHNMFSRKNWAYRQGSGYWKIPVNWLDQRTNMCMCFGRAPQSFVLFGRFLRFAICTHAEARENTGRCLKIVCILTKPIGSLGT